MRRKVCVWVSLGLLAVMLSGCGGQYAGGYETDDALLQQGVSGSALSEKEERKPAGETYRYCSDTNLYQTICQEDKVGVIQTRLDGSCETFVPIPDLGQVQFVDAEWLYYDRLDDDRLNASEIPTTVICRIPIETDEDGYDVLNVGQTEELVSGIETKAHFYVDSEYVLYMRAEDGRFMKYDIQNREEIPNEFGGKDASPGVCRRCGDTFILEKANDGQLFAQRVDEREWTKIRDEKTNWGLDAWNDEVYFSSLEAGQSLLRQSIELYDVRTKERRVFVDKKQLRQTAAKALGVNGNEKAIQLCSIEDMFCEGSRLYIQVQVEWLVENVMNTCYIILSKGQEEAGLIYERELTECMHGYVETNREEGGDYGAEVWNDAQCICMVNGKAYLSLYDYENKKGRLGRYELATGDFRWIALGDPEYYEPYYNDDNCWNSEVGGYRLEGVFESDMMDNVFTGFYW